MVAEAQFIMGLENETKETIEETYRLAQDWKPDMANWNMYTPWPFAELFEELGDKVEVRDYAKYNFVTPIIQPEGMTRDEVLKGVMKNYARFYMLQELPLVPVAARQLQAQVPDGLPQGVRQDDLDQEVLRPRAAQVQRRQRAVGPGFRREQGAQRRADRAGEARPPGPRRRRQLRARKRVHVPIKVMACGSGDHAAHDDDADYLDHVDHENNVDHEAALARQ